MLAYECEEDEDYEEQQQNIDENLNFQNSTTEMPNETTEPTKNNTFNNNETTNTLLRKNAIEEFLESRTQLFNLPFRLELPSTVASTTPTNFDCSVTNPLKRSINNVNESAISGDNHSDEFIEKEKNEKLLLNGWNNSNGSTNYVNSISMNGYSMKFDETTVAATKRLKKNENTLNQLFNQVNQAQQLINASILESCEIGNNL